MSAERESGSSRVPVWGSDLPRISTGSSPATVSWAAVFR